MTFEVFFEFSRFFPRSERNGRFYSPRAVLGCMRVVSLVVRLKAGLQIISQHSVSVGCVFIIYKDINVGKAIHFFPLAWDSAFGYALTSTKGVAALFHVAVSRVRNDYCESNVISPASPSASDFTLQAPPGQDAVAVFACHFVRNLFSGLPRRSSKRFLGL